MASQQRILTVADDKYKYLARADLGLTETMTTAVCRFIARLFGHLNQGTHIGSLAKNSAWCGWLTNVCRVCPVESANVQSSTFPFFLKQKLAHDSTTL